MKEINFENIFIDGTKIEANANRYSFVWKKSIDKFERKLQEKTLELINKISDEFNVECNINTDKLSIDSVNSLLTQLNLIKKSNNIEFVYGKGKRKSKLQKYVELLGNFIDGKLKYSEYNTIFNGRNSFSNTYHDATFMHMKVKKIICALKEIIKMLI